MNKGKQRTVFLGTFYENNLVLELQDEQIYKTDNLYQKQYENYILNLKKNAVENYKEKLLLENYELKSKEMENTLWYKIRKLLTTNQ